MGLFSGLTKALGFGGGGSTSQTSTQKTTVKNEVEVNIPLDELSETLELISDRDFFLESKLASKEFSERDQDQFLKLAELKQKAKEQEQEQTYRVIMVLVSITGLVIAFIGHYKKKGSK